MSDPWAAIAAETRLKLANDETVIEKNRAKVVEAAKRTLNEPSPMLQMLKREAT